MRAKIWGMALLLPAAVLVGGPLSAQGPSPEQAKVDHRRAVMTGSGMAGVTLARMAQGLIEPENVAGLARYWALGAALARDAFSTDTSGAGVETKAKDAVWLEWGDFSSRMRAYAADVEEIAALAEAGDEAGALAKVGPTLREHCKDCHDEYRSE